MAMSVTGGGSGSGTAVVAVNSYNNLALFTTPDVANTMYIISVTWAPHAAAGKFGVTCATPGAYSVSKDGTDYVLPLIGGGPNMMKVGRNAAVTLSFTAYNEAGNVAYSYNYVTMTMDTN